MLEQIEANNICITWRLEALKDIKISLESANDDFSQNYCMKLEKKLQKEIKELRQETKKIKKKYIS